MIVVFILGSIASGKSTAARYLESRGARRIDLDVLAKELYLPGSCIVCALRDAFGSDIIDAEGRVIPHVLADRAFIDASSASRLADIVYPELESLLASLIERERKDWQQPACSDLASGLLVVEVSAPFGFEHAFRLCDTVLAICAPLEARERFALSRGMSAGDFKRRSDLQPHDDELAQLADCVIRNTGNLHDLHASLDAWLRALRERGEGSIKHGS